MDTQHHTLQANEYAASCAAAWLVEAERNQCYRNAHRLLWLLPGGAADTYVEGWFLLETPREILIAEHAWCELAVPDEQEQMSVLDPTIGLRAAPDTEEPWTALYVPGVRYGAQEVLSWTDVRLPAAWQLSEKQPPQAYDAAYQHACMLARERARVCRPAKQITIVLSY